MIVRDLDQIGIEVSKVRRDDRPLCAGSFYGALQDWHALLLMVLLVQIDFLMPEGRATLPSPNGTSIISSTVVYKPLPAGYLSTVRTK